MALFKDQLSGCVVEFTMEHDIKAMREHPEYTEVFEEVKPEPVKPVPAKKASKED